MIQETSKQAYESIKEELGNRQKQVYEALRILESANNRMVSQYLKMPINSIVPRVHELRSKKLVGVDKTGLDPITGRSTIFWTCVNK